MEYAGSEYYHHRLGGEFFDDAAVLCNESTEKQEIGEGSFRWTKRGLCVRLLWKTLDPGGRALVVCWLCCGAVLPGMISFCEILNNGVIIEE